jgi:choline dehydrogenase-like flavoprotein
MFVDARAIESGARLACDVCIIGAGAAGISLARELRGGRGRVCVLESGGLEPDAETQALYRGHGTGLANDGYVETSRLRYFGGSTNHWWGMCAPLDAHDFEPRPWVPHSGWPLSRVDLDPYYARAQPVCQLGPFDYDPAAWDPDPPPLGPRAERRMWQYGPPTRFGAVYREELRASTNVSVHLFANAVDLSASDSGRRVERVVVKTLAGGQFTVAARTVVLAAGGIENPRLLLGSDGVVNGGLGNGRDLVGRFFMDHPHRHPAGEILFDDPRLAAWSGKQVARGTRFLIHLGIRPEVQRQHGLLNGSIQLVHPWGAEDETERSLLSLLRDLAGGAGAGAPKRAELFARIEQAPNPESRVRLSEERDALGQRRVVLDWRLGALERDALQRILEMLAEDLAAAGTARVRIGTDAAPAREFGGEHHMGTTRMSDDPATGVVDRDCRVHGIENLYVAGSAVFPTVGWANPTLTIVALSLRLADHLKRTLEL